MGVSSSPGLRVVSWLLGLLVVATMSPATKAQREASVNSDGRIDTGFGGSCSVVRPFDPERHKEVYTVGVLAIRGEEAAYTEFNRTFADYLSETAGRRFDPSIRFEMKPLNFLSLFTDIEDELVDYIYVNPSAFSCIESEYEAQSLVSQISRRKVAGSVYDLKKFGGVILTRHDRDDIQTITDLRGKIIAAASISGLGSGQMQFLEMENAGMSYVNDPRQLVFTSNQGKVVNGVLNGDFDVGFIRTDQLERSKDADGNPVNTSLFKIIDPKPGLQIDGAPFPFESSTNLYPEWNLAAVCDDVPADVSREVQEAMLALADHARIAEGIQTCHAEYNETFCNETLSFPLDFGATRCDTSQLVAELALQAMEDGKYAGWTSTLSYMQLRSMQDSTGFIVLQPETNTWHCVRSAEIYESITCPDDLVKKSREEVNGGCQAAGLDCQEGFQCICNPCYEITECIDAADVMGRCVPYSVLLPAILVPIAVISLATCLGVVWHKQQQLIKQADQAARNERDLNEYIAHELRNPLSACISSCTFVNAAVRGKEPITGAEERATLREDVLIIDSGLRYMNQLLRSILDVHRAEKSQMTLARDNVGILQDIFEPVSSMIYTRDANFDLLLDCPEDLSVETDRLRLHQVVLNLARNSAKFVVEGYVRLRADVVDNDVCIFIEDSGPGIPTEKRANLFRRYQQSLDSLAQGTGVGLSLCKQLVELMGGDIWLDETFVSDHGDCPGARIVINLKKPPIETSKVFRLESPQPVVSTTGSARSVDSPRLLNESASELPEQLNILMVDDDRILRKQASRAIGRVLRECNVREAASGETALKLVEAESYDIIFMDQYMASVEQSLTGTETVRALRAKGVRSIICGLSANDTGPAFTNAGADGFLLKPFPCKEVELVPVLKDLLSKRGVDTCKIDATIEISVSPEMKLETA